MASKYAPAQTSDPDSPHAPHEFKFDKMRLRAAMKVTGITEEDIKPAARGREETRWTELAERKRRGLIRDLEATAGALDDDDVEALLSPGGSNTVGGLDQTLWERGKARIDKKRAKLRDDIKRDVTKNLEELQASKAASKQTEEVRKRFSESPWEKPQDPRNAEPTKNEKMKEKIKALNQAAWAKRRELQQHLQDTQERAEKLMSEKCSSLEEARQGRRTKQDEARAKFLEQEMREVENRLRRHEEVVAKEEECRARAEQIRQENMEKTIERHCNHSDRAGALTERSRHKEQEEVEKAFVEHTSKIADARQQHVHKKKEIADKAVAKRDKEFTKWTACRQAKREEYRARIHGFREILSKDKTELVEKHRSATVEKTAEWHRIFQDLVDQNRSRNGRSEDCAREQMLAKIQATNTKSESVLEQKRHLLEYHMDVHKEGIHGRLRLEELKGHLRPGRSTRKANAILEELGLPPMASIMPQREAEDGEEKKQ